MAGIGFVFPEGFLGTTTCFWGPKNNSPSLKVACLPPKNRCSKGDDLLVGFGLFL